MDLEQMIEQRVCALEKEFEAPPFVGWMPARERFRRIARAELEREGRLVEALANLVCASRNYTPNSLAVSDADAAVRAYEAEFAPKQRTVEQIARDIVAAHQFKNADVFIPVPRPLMDELSAALGKDGK